VENNHNIWIPRTNLIGVGAIKDLPNELLAWKLSKALIVTDKNIISLGYIETVEDFTMVKRANGIKRLISSFLIKTRLNQGKINMAHTIT